MSFVKAVRDRLGWNRVKFAQAIGRSHQSVRNYEHGIEPPADVLERVRALAQEHGITAPQDDKPAARDGQDDEWHRRLDIILQQADPESIRIVKENLAYFSAAASRQDRTVAKKKRA